MEFVYWSYLVVFIIVIVILAQYLRLRAEEEEMNPDIDSSSGDWEYKILWGMSRTAFSNPEVMHEALEDESKAGWTLFEKLDNRRLRLKRPVSARAQDASLDFDPYRIVPPRILETMQVKGRRNIKIAVVVFVCMILAGIAFGYFNSPPRPPNQGNNAGGMPPGEAS